MPHRPRLLDLYCGAGGAAMGYQRAGFDVVGVDIDPQPDYPFRFHQADALTFPLDDFDAFHASPPCQAYTTMSNRHRGRGGLADGRPDLIDATRGRLTGRLYIIENVPGARSEMRSPITLHGGMFGLRAYRPRLFECSFLAHPPPRAEAPHNPPGVYGKAPDGRLLFRRSDGTEQRAASSVEDGRDALGIDWPMEWRGVAEAIPPAYTEWLGRQLLAFLP